MLLIDILNSAEKKLAGAGVETPRLDAEVLLAHLLKIQRADLHIRRETPVDQKNSRNFDEIVKKRATGCPVAYITGYKEFWSIPIKVTPDVLIPRPETELVVECALEILRSRDSRFTIHDSRLLDLCAGSGCIAAALATELKNATFVAADISEKALAVAKENLLFAGDRVEFIKGDLFEPVSRSFDVVVSNPPYIAENEKGFISRSITDYEPPLALYGGKDGLDIVKKIVHNVPPYLKKGGWLIMEIGASQAGAMVKAADAACAFREIKVRRDLSGRERVLCLRKD